MFDDDCDIDDLAAAARRRDAWRSSTFSALRRQAHSPAFGGASGRSQGAVASQSSPHDEQRRRVRVPRHAARALAIIGLADEQCDGLEATGGPDVPVDTGPSALQSMDSAAHRRALVLVSQNVDVTAAVELCLAMVGRATIRTRGPTVRGRRRSDLQSRFARMKFEEARG